MLDEKPTMTKFFRPLVDTLNKLYTMGKAIQILILQTLSNESLYLFLRDESPYTPLGQLTCRIALIAWSCDLPARTLLTNIVPYNVRNGCHLCEDTGANERSKPLHRWWPFNKDMVLRSHHSLIDNARTATETHSSVGLDILL